MNKTGSFWDVAYQELTYFPEPDPRTHDWFLMQSPGPVLAITALYYYVVNKGPQWMENRKPFHFPRVLFIYNIFLVFLSVYISYLLLGTAIQDNYTLFGCQPVVKGDSPLALKMASGVWWYFFSKIIELLDTVFFILRKKNNQLSFLHIYHHGSLPFFSWISARYVPGGDKFWGGGLNGMVHTVMYSYYALSALGPNIQKYLWWKKYITRLQLVQFCLVITHSMWTIAFVRPCAFPKLVNIWLVVYPGSFLILFLNFYRMEYVIRNKQQKSLHKE